MIRTFRCEETERLYRRERSKRFQGIEHTARRMLVMLDSAAKIKDLASPPGNRLEALKGNHQGQHSIRINDQWRICFVWRDGNAYDVEIVDYH